MRNGPGCRELAVKAKTHLYIVATVLFFFGLWIAVTGAIFAVAFWPDWDSMRHGQASIAHIFQLTLSLTGAIAALLSLFYFKIANSYCRAARLDEELPSIKLIIIFMILFFPVGTVLGGYALFARRRYLQAMAEK